MPDRIYAHVPYHRLAENLETIISARINPEIFFPADTLDSLIPEEAAAIMNNLRSAGLCSTIHAPFMDLNPGSFEPLLRQATIHRFEQVLAAAEIVQPEMIVMHPGYDRWRYGDRQPDWLELALPVFRMVDAKAAAIGCRIAIENIFDEEPSVLKALIEAIDSPRVGHCFDVGHWNLFHSVSMAEWFAELGERIIHVHVHDNHGQRDDHFPIGDGNIDFDEYFRLMDRYAPNASYAIEAHDRNKVLLAQERLLKRLKG